MKRLLTDLLVVLGLMSGQVSAGSLWPDIPKATGKPHPEGNLWMRINHMRFLKHDRNLTMREGDREIEFSLKACVECHQVKGADGQPVSVKDDTHFCRVCHDFAAVRIDCFECHNSKPAEPVKQVLLRPEIPDTGEIVAYLKEAQQ
ncbi:MAG: hypothetical protein ACE5DK_09365 [Paracoccaceae bacterium]